MHTWRRRGVYNYARRTHTTRNDDVLRAVGSHAHLYTHTLTYELTCTRVSVPKPKPTQHTHTYDEDMRWYYALT